MTVEVTRRLVAIVRALGRLVVSVWRQVYSLALTWCADRLTRRDADGREWSSRVLLWAARTGHLTRESAACDRLARFAHRNRITFAMPRTDDAHLMAHRILVTAGASASDVRAIAAMLPLSSWRRDLLVVAARRARKVGTWRALVDLGPELPADAWQALADRTEVRRDPHVWNAIMHAGRQGPWPSGLNARNASRLLFTACFYASDREALHTAWVDLALVNWAAAEEIRLRVRPEQIHPTRADLAELLARGTAEARLGALRLLAEVDAGAA